MRIAKWLIVFLVSLGMSVPALAVELSLGGFPSFMRTRARFISDATFISALSDTDAESLGFDNADDNIFFVDTRLRLTPQLVLSDSVTIRAQVDVADNMIWGGFNSQFVGGRRTLVNSSLTPSDRFRGALLTESGFATAVAAFGEQDAVDDPGFFNVRMLHADIVLPSNLGFVRIGRQPFDFGLGILANGGWDPLSDLGFVLDRFLYLKSFPIANSTFTFVFVSDRLDQGTSLVTGQGSGYDIGAVALILNVPDVFGGNLTLGAYDFPYIHQENVLSTSPTQSGLLNPPITPGANTDIDLDWLNLYAGLIDWKSDFLRIAAEVQGAFGEISGLGPADDVDPSNLIFAARAEVYPGFPVKVIGAEFGWAGGDDTSTPDFEGNVIHFNPAYNLDNLLYKHIIPNIYRIEGSVINSYYARAWGTVKLLDDLSFTPQVVVGWNEETDSPLIPGESVDTYLGTEVEGTLTWQIHPGVNLDLIGSLVIAGSGLEDLIEQQAAATYGLVDFDGDGAADGAAPPDGVDAEDLPWAAQARLLIFIDQFFK